MATRRITAEAIDKMIAGDQLWDPEVRGFGARHQGGGAVYRLKTRIKGKQVILTIGRHGRGYWGPESARREAIRLLGLIRDGKDPAKERDDAKAAPTLQAFAARYISEYGELQKKPRTLEEDKRLLNLHILPVLGQIKLRELGKIEVAKFHSAMRSTPVAANRALSLLSAIMGWAERVGERPDGSNPCKYISKNPEQGRERYLSGEELARLGDALAGAEAAGIAEWRAVAAIRLLLFTGARLSEILTLKWSYIDQVSGIARLPDSKTGRKNLFLSAPALELLTTLPRFAGSDYVLPGEKAGMAFVGIQKPWQRIRAVAGLGDVHLHDLRHSFASVGVATGDSLLIIGRLLGHKQASTTERYAHLAADPAKAAADRTGTRIAAMLGGGGRGEVVPLTPKRRAG